MSGKSERRKEKGDCSVTGLWLGRVRDRGVSHGYQDNSKMTRPHSGREEVLGLALTMLSMR